MKTLFLSMLDGLFTKDNKEICKHTTDKIFFTETDPDSSRTLIIEEDDYAIWVRLLNLNKEEIDFEGFLCAVVDPKNQDVDTDKAFKKENPLPAGFANSHSCIKNLNKEDIDVQWQNNCVAILISGTTYLMMDMNSKISYSKALSIDCEYGKKLEHNTCPEF